jgi:hypothetical protein
MVDHVLHDKINVKFFACPNFKMGIRIFSVTSPVTVPEFDRSPSSYLNSRHLDRSEAQWRGPCISSLALPFLLSAIAASKTGAKRKNQQS